MKKYKYDGANMLNMDITYDGIVRPRKGFKTFSGMVWQLWLINNRFEKMGIQGDFMVRLPLPEGDFEYRYVTKQYKPKYDSVMTDYIEIQPKKWRQRGKK